MKFEIFHGARSHFASHEKNSVKISRKLVNI